MDGDRRALGNLERRARNRAVVGQHPHGRVADPLLDRDDLELELIAVGELDQLGLAGLRQTLGLARELDRLAVGSWLGSCIGYILSVGRASAGAPRRPLCARPSRAFDSWCSAICSAMNSASSLTQPISAEPRVYCQVRPRK